MKLFTAIIGGLALAVAGTAAFFSVRGIGLLFAGASIAAMVMAGVLEAGKLAMTSFLYRYWERIPRALKWYSTIAVIVLVGITSLGIYGFLSDAYDDTRSRVEMHENNIDQLNKEILVIETEISTLQNTDNKVDTKKQDTIDGFQKIYDDFVKDRRARQDALSARNKSDAEVRSDRRQQLLDRLAVLDQVKSELESKPGGLFSNNKKKIEDLRIAQQPERDSIASSLKTITDEESNATKSYNDALAKIDDEISAEYEKFVEKVNGLRDTTKEVDSAPKIEAHYQKIKDNQAEILKEKEAIRSTDIGSFKFIAESFNQEVDTVVKWFIIVIVLVFDPVAVALVLAYNIMIGGRITRGEELP
ncbi:MAG: hypothetical protein EBY39_14875, partial [Flavobacteriia bacterium]|nr:hypothetical protein [Flavobacteriia bacterium]